MLRRICLSLLFVGFLAAVSCGGKTYPTQPVMPTQGAAATPTPVPAGSATVNVGPGGGTSFMDMHSGSSTTTISAGQTVNWVFMGLHSTTSGNCCTANGLWDSGVRSSGTFSRMFPSAGTFPYYCTVHGVMMTGTVVVTP